MESHQRSAKMTARLGAVTLANDHPIVGEWTILLTAFSGKHDDTVPKPVAHKTHEDLGECYHREPSMACLASATQNRFRRGIASPQPQG